MNAIEFAAAHSLRIVPVGSRVTCNPPPTDTDCDYICLVDAADFRSIVGKLVASEWKAGGSLSHDLADLDGMDRATFRCGEDNLIVTTSAAFYDSFMAGTAIAKSLNLMQKSDRVTLFQILREFWPGLAS